MTVHSVKREKETMLHLLYKCEVVKEIWQEIKKLCKGITDKDNCEISEENIMLNRVNGKPSHIFNFITIVTKQYIYATKCSDKKLSFQELKGKIELFQRYELFQAKKDDKVTQHCRKWYIENEYNGTGLEDEIVNRYIHDMRV